MSRDTGRSFISAREYPANARHSRVIGFSFRWQNRERVFMFDDLTFPEGGQVPNRRWNLRSVKGDRAIAKAGEWAASGHDRGGNRICEELPIPDSMKLWRLDITTTLGNNDIRTVIIRLESGNDFSDSIQIHYIHEGDK